MSDLARARAALIWLTIGSYLVVLPLTAQVGLHVDYGFVGPFALWFILALICGITFRPWPRIRAATESFLYGVLLVIPIIIAVYLAARLNLPLADDQLKAMDQALGVDWPALLRFIDSRPYLAQPLNLAYESFTQQLIWLPIVLAVFGRPLRSYQMILMYAVIYFLGCVISIWYPALGTYATFNIHPADLQNIDRTWGYVFLDELNGVRSDPQFIFSLTKAEGIMTFPSLHAASAVLFAWAAWEQRWLRYPFLFLNVIMAISAAIVGNHYTVDVIAGMGFAGFGIAIVLITVPGKRPDPQIPSLNPNLSSRNAIPSSAPQQPFPASLR
ncbi:phosphatase PAP2 family protein [Mesorhizobium sp. CA6]|uniref:phosphatase PAP2 family protein n=1 Tax=Mesorhizobium sp. CA6 TaxID=588500 RepID=UPI001CC9E49E|nr:phosphatase PAP2 family protein [Mesorhizobium sp. CA6]MBZ9765504.1 phosphatase PAP2 family protein [Mesorhizobium sp. CA6]